MIKNLDDIYLLYFHDIYRFLLSLCHDHHLAEDLVQETFLRAHLYIENYNGEKVKTWLFTVAHHAFIDYYRKQKRTVLKDENFFLPFIDKQKSLIETIVDREEVGEIIQQLEGLPDKHKFAVLLHDFHGLSYNEAAQVMNIKQSHFKVMLFRGRQAIRNRKGDEK
ncbi:sigma-70 family RNA polymerase sigma factor [Metabacillus malikii]|uniref:RNA polymerase sigma-70 factor (ECF subfamily) n=1 Tax=Metabacillus malikii TaxID=1504265 RepID=A0ABT9ZII4_9BACI|nr:sigma-70 family RNA polymerase sigma factor [Metabacillus malikii]MDQ0231795.1 RNA polymerase sigma-70 factor (ECF subfamily) [Metabacillus malikii]